MKNIFTLCLLACAYAPNISAETLYLTCKQASSPNINISALYKNPPSDLNQVNYDLLDQGLISLARRPAESWVVDTKNRSISTPEQTGSPPFLDAEITTASIQASRSSPSGNIVDFHINRVTGNLTYQINLTQEIAAEWNRTHGGTLPRSWVWQFRCRAQSRPAL